MITYDETLEKLNAIVASKPEGYRYTTDPKAIEQVKLEDMEFGLHVDEDGNEYVSTCFYKHLDGTPGCIVGHFLAQVDPDFQPSENENAMTQFKYPGAPKLTPEAIDLLSYTQNYQDKGETWADAVQKAVGKVRDDD